VTIMTLILGTINAYKYSIKIRQQNDTSCSMLKKIFSKILSFKSSSSKDACCCSFVPVFGVNAPRVAQEVAHFLVKVAQKLLESCPFPPKCSEVAQILSIVLIDCSKVAQILSTMLKNCSKLLRFWTNCSKIARNCSNFGQIAQKLLTFF